MGALKGLTDAVGITSPEQAKLVAAKRQESFTSGLGTATDGSFKYNRSADQQGVVDGANKNLNDIIQGGLAIDQNRLDNNKSAFLNARSPQMERNLAQQAQARAASSAVGGTSGSSSDMYKNAMGNMLANEQRSKLQNDAVLGSEQMAQQQLNQQLQQGAFYQGINQADIDNQLNAMNATTGALNNTNTMNLNFSNQGNQMEQSRVDSINSANAGAFKNLLGAGMAIATGGSSLGLGSLGGLFSGGGEGGGGGGGFTDYSSPEGLMSSGFSLGNDNYSNNAFGMKPYG